MLSFSLKDQNGNPPMDHFALLSPLGTISQALDNPVGKTWPGVAAQGLIALLPATLFLISQARARRARILAVCRLFRLFLPQNLSTRPPVDAINTIKQYGVALRA